MQTAVFDCPVGPAIAILIEPKSEMERALRAVQPVEVAGESGWYMFRGVPFFWMSIGFVRFVQCYTFIMFPGGLIRPPPPERFQGATCPPDLLAGGTRY